MKSISLPVWGKQWISINRHQQADSPASPFQIPNMSRFFFYCQLQNRSQLCAQMWKKKEEFAVVSVRKKTPEETESQRRVTQCWSVNVECEQNILRSPCHISPFSMRLARGRCQTSGVMFEFGLEHCLGVEPTGSITPPWKSIASSCVCVCVCFRTYNMSERKRKLWLHNKVSICNTLIAPFTKKPQKIPHAVSLQPDWLWW